MLQIKNISKTYKTGNLIQKALDNVSLTLRDNEFVAILGPSGSGKTTLLNIIGGLDKYDSGDLIINNISTKDYKDRDWDSYRNHTIGFIFQSYNLIPHQTVLANVEMALTIAGTPASEKKKLVLEALDKVGLKAHAYKKPSQLSGGQMQRVAIARALVNNPSIVLADEPTGALDTKTSIQVMDLLKEVANDRLVVMVTHNPELAKSYASRIVNLKDGVITGDSNPCNEVHQEVKKRNFGKASMNFLTALSLSFNNLLSKKGRTILTSLAGSIGIIGIALILALSTGFQNYIDSIQDDTMNSYPLTIQEETSNVFGAMLNAKFDLKEKIKEGTVKEGMVVSSMINSIGSNDLVGFMNYLNEHQDLYQDDLKKINYSYSIAPKIYSRDVTGNIVKLNPSNLLNTIYSDGTASLLSSVSASSSMGSFAEHDLESLKDNTSLLKGNYPTKYNEVMLVLSEKVHIPDLLVYSLGLRDGKELQELLNSLMNKKETTINNEPLTFTYDNLLNIEMKLIDASSLYRFNSRYQTYEDMSDDSSYLEKIYKQSESLTISGIALASEDSGMTGIIYLPELTSHVMDKAKDSEIVKKQLANKDIDVFSNNSFSDKEKKNSIDFNELVTVDEEMLKKAFSIDLDTNSLSKVDYPGIILNNSNAIKESIADTTNTLANTLIAINSNLASNIISSYNTMFKQSVPYVTECEGGSFKDSSNPYLGCEFSEEKVIDVDYKELANGFKYSLISGYQEDIYISYAEDFMDHSNPDFFLDTLFNSTEFNNQLDTIVTTLEKDAHLKASKDNLKKIGSEIFKAYFNEVRNSTYFNTTNSLIKADDLANINLKDIANKIISNDDNANIIYGEAYNSAKELITYLAMKGVGNAVGEVTSPFMKMFENLGNSFKFDTEAFSKAFNFNMKEEDLSRLMSSTLTSSNASYRNNLIELGYQEKDEPTAISFYFKDFKAKENFMKVINDYNNSCDKEKEIKYVDVTGMLMSSVQTIVNAVTYVLIAFVSISLVVSSIMIAVITLISVMERTKEIGILRAMGASKKNVSSIFNAETFIIGLFSGIMGVTISILLTFPINNIIHSLTGIETINATLNLKPAIYLILISVILTVIAGLLPSRKAAKQDPVIALRSE